MATPPGFYNQGDQAIYSAGDFFIPQERFRAAPYNATNPAPDDPANSGIPAVYRPQGGGDGGFNPYNPDMSQIRTDYNPNFDFRAYQDFGALTSDQLTTASRKEMDMYPEYYGVDTGVPKTGIAGFMDKAVNFIPGVGALKTAGKFIGGALNQFMPINQRAIMENELRGQGVFVDDIGRIVAGPGGYNTPEGIMAGYNANKMTEQTFDKRTGNIAETLQDKYGVDISQLTDEELANFDPNSPAYNLVNRVNLINQAKQNFIKTQNKAAEIARFEEQQRKERAFQAQLNQQQRDQRQSDLNRIDRAYREETGGQGGSYATGESGVQSDGSYNDPFDPGGGEKDGGFIDGTNRRMDFMMGGLADLVDIYD